MAVLLRLVILTVCAAAQAQYAEERAPRYIASESKVAPTPVPILKQINRHNEDGSYTYGYEGADGSFKIETKTQNGEVKGKYGYKDDTGKLRVIEYGANKYGFQPAGEGITVAPPTLVDESTREPGKGNKQYRDYDYEDPAPAPAPAPRSRPVQPAYRAPPPPQQQYRPEPQQYRPEPQQYRPAPQPYRPPPQQAAPVPPKPAFFAGAAPAPPEDNFFNPEPQPKQYRPKQDFRPAPQPQHFAPKHTQAEFQDYNQQPRYTQASQYQEPQPRPHKGQTFSMLDQLLKEYSLPQGNSAPTHDITFGSF